MIKDKSSLPLDFHYLKEINLDDRPVRKISYVEKYQGVSYVGHFYKSNSNVY